MAESRDSVYKQEFQQHNLESVRVRGPKAEWQPPTTRMDCQTSYAGSYNVNSDTTAARQQQFHPQSEMGMPTGQIQWGSTSREAFKYVEGVERSRPTIRPRGELETLGGEMEFQPVSQADYKPPGHVDKLAAVRPGSAKVRLGDPASEPPTYLTSYQSNFDAKQISSDLRGPKAPQQHRISNVSFNGE